MITKDAVHSTVRGPTGPQTMRSRLWIAGGVAAIAALVVNLLLARLAVGLFHIAGFSPLNGPVVVSVLSVGGALAATLALALVYRIAERPTGGSRRVLAGSILLAGVLFALFTVTVALPASIVAAAAIYVITGRLAERPLENFYWIAGVALIFSFVPDLALFGLNGRNGATPTAILTLMTMHLTTAAIVVGALTAAVRGTVRAS